MQRKRKWKRAEKPEYDVTVHGVLNALSGIPATQIAAHTWVSAGTISKWRLGYEFGGTRHPQHSTLAAVARVAGMEFKLVQSNEKPPMLDTMRKQNGHRDRR